MRMMQHHAASSGIKTGEYNAGMMDPLSALSQPRKPLFHPADQWFASTAVELQ